MSHQKVAPTETAHASLPISAAPGPDGKASRRRGPIRIRFSYIRRPESKERVELGLEAIARLILRAPFSAAKM